MNPKDKRKSAKSNPNLIEAPVLSKAAFTEALQEQIGKLCVRPLKEGTICVDLSRLGKKHHVLHYTPTGEIKTLFPPEGFSLTTRSDCDFVRCLFKILARELDVSQIFNETFDFHFGLFQRENIVSKYIDFTKNIDEYLELLTEANPIVKILKASCSQGILSPPFVHLRLSLLKDYPFKDVKQGWKVFIEFKQNSVAVVHRKKQASQNNEFDFCWELRMLFDKHVNYLSSSCCITNFNIDDTLEKSRRDKLEQIFNSWFEPTALPEYLINKEREKIQNMKDSQLDMQNLKREIATLKQKLVQTNETIKYLSGQNNFNILLDPEVYEIHYFDCFDKSTESHLILHSKTIIYVNSAFINEIKMEKKKILGQNITDLFPTCEIELIKKPQTVSTLVDPRRLYSLSIEPYLPGCLHYLVGKITILIPSQQHSSSVGYGLTEEQLLSFVW